MKTNKILFLAMILTGVYGLSVKADQESRKMDLYYKIINGDSLFKAFQHEEGRVVGYLHNNIQDINFRVEGKPLLYYAMKQEADFEDYENFLTLIKYGGVDVNAEIKEQNKDMITLFLFFIKYKVFANNLNWRMNALKELVQEGRANINVVNRNGDGALYFAARNNEPKIIDYLADRGANVNIQNNNGNTPLHEAVRQKRKDAVIALLRNRADINMLNNKGQSPLDIAIASKNNEITTLLLGTPPRN